MIPKYTLFLTGQPRFYQYGYEYFNKYLFESNGGRENFRVFLHAWWNKDKIGEPWSGPPWLQPNKAGYIEPNTPEDLVSLYQPDSCVIERQRNFTNHRNYSSFCTLTPPWILRSCFYSIQQAIQLANNAPSTEMSICGRYDWVPLHPIKLNDYDPSLLTIADDIKPNPENKEACNANFLITDTVRMRAFSELYDLMDDYWVYDGVRMGGETMVGWHLSQVGIKNPVPIKYAFIRQYAECHNEIAYDNVDRYLRN